MDDQLSRDLKAIPLFAGLTERTLLELSRVALRRTYAPGTLILLGGDPCVAVFFIVAGQARIYRLSAQGRQQVLATLGPGQSFNTAPPFVPEASNPASVEAVGETTVLTLRKDTFLSLVRECPDLSWAILGDFASRLLHLTDLVEDLALRSVRGRLARFLLEQADGLYVNRQWTQDEMAVHLGTVRDVVGRALRGLVDAGLLRIERGRIVLLDREGLEAESDS
ncbi:MAG: Cyclic AMP receptor-like protein [Chloroflexi bacterium ADurb.Bin360]|nr:MAG: Cyclic AMP receptor-like protein [Chloroflexi bacterium ADurb.Bin360]